MRIAQPVQLVRLTALHAVSRLGELSSFQAYLERGSGVGNSREKRPVTVGIVPVTSVNLRVCHRATKDANNPPF